MAGLDTDGAGSRPIIGALGLDVLEGITETLDPGPVLKKGDGVLANDA